MRPQKYLKIVKRTRPSKSKLETTNGEEAAENRLKTMKTKPDEI
jgi:hypothetical protein